MNAAEPELRKLVDLELEAANRENPPFHSAHEGYAVILEEVDEVQEEICSLLNWSNALWSVIKRDEFKKRGSLAVSKVENHAVRLAAEALQVAAMARKFQQLGGKQDDAPAVDAEPVRHGRWEHGMQCSFCKQIDTTKPNYCPNCGARMDAEEEEK